MSPVVKQPTIKAALAALGDRIARLRLSRNLTQASIAREAGTSVSSIKRLEAGENTSLDTMLRVLEVLGVGDRLLEALPNPEVRPVERVRHKGRERQRASGTPEAVPRAVDWAWGNEGDA